ncbi:hypothetical protein Pla22_35280 [Rubripirellula amarantea]|uniref:Uncharacterized protein n=1 Tax=Rubripirellula amarantea TaxID=2527999 RepID=A0A5C5WKX0_9BACT|nr:hypothetical protein [Rubripirellula amarantea]TWT50785.1 hypothetical protein Pla22_35280 [Rubripirellula amarantea]
MTHRELLRLIVVRSRFRMHRSVSRFLSPRRIIASVLAASFMVLYVLAGVMILSTRQPADPGRLQLWLSGGMVLYAIYHSTKCAWSSSSLDLDLSPSEQWMLGGAPLRRSSLAIYHVLQIVPATFMKTCLLAVVLAVDVTYPAMLVVGIFASLMMLEVCRLTVTRMAGGMEPRGIIVFRAITSTLAAAIVFQVVMRIIAMVPLGAPPPMYLSATFRSLGQTAASEMVQWISMPWHCAANVAVSDSLNPMTALFLLASLIALPTSVLAFVVIDRRCLLASSRWEHARLHSGEYESQKGHVENRVSSLSVWPTSFGLTGLLSAIDIDASSVAYRMAVSVSRYRGTILFSFAIPSAICLSPLLSSRINHPWLFVVGGVGMCTSLVAPSALRLDFRRDLKRMLLLRTLPINPASMVLGQLWFPILITCVFQVLVLSVAALVLHPGWYQFLMYVGMLAALSVFTFATENALFLAYPHRERNEGIGMLIRTKLTFLGKTSIVLGAFILLAVWATFCKGMLPESLVGVAVISGALVVTWGAAAGAFAVTTWCWRRFDLSSEMMV